MNDVPVPPFQPTPAPEDNPVPQPAQQAMPPHQSPQGSQALSTWSLALGITALVLAIVVFISIPAAIVAVVLGIIALVKHHPGKGKALAGIITAGIALLIIPVVIVIAITGYNGLSNYTSGAHDTSIQQRVDSLLGTASDGNTVDNACFSYTIPTGYEADNTTKGCTTAVNIPNGDSLTRITVKGNTGMIGSLQDVVTMFTTTLKSNNHGTGNVIDQEQFTSNGHTVYYISYKDANGLLFGNYIIPDTSASQTDETGKTITAYTVAGYIYNSSLKDLVRGVLDSLTIK